MILETICFRSIENYIYVSWAAYHASSQLQQSHVIYPNSLLPLFHEPAHTMAMIEHSFNALSILEECIKLQLLHYTLIFKTP